MCYFLGARVKNDCIKDCIKMETIFKKNHVLCLHVCFHLYFPTDRPLSLNQCSYMWQQLWPDSARKNGMNCPFLPRAVLFWSHSCLNDSITITQDSYFNWRRFGRQPACPSLSLPQFVNLCQVYLFSALSPTQHNTMCHWLTTYMEFKFKLFILKGGNVQ